MDAQIEMSVRILREFLEAEERDLHPVIERDQVVSHATLSGLVHHWPSKATPELLDLLGKTERIKAVERSRWAVQRRIAIAKLARA